MTITRRTRSAVALAVAAGTALAIAGGATVAQRSSERNDAADAARVATDAALASSQRSVTVSDALADTDFAVADVVESTLTADADGTIVARVTVDEYTAPTSDAWSFGDTRITWFIDIDGDENENARVRLEVTDDGELRAGVLGRRDRVRCLGEASVDAAMKTYSVSFSAACLGNPEQLRFRTAFQFDDVAFDLVDSDRAPETGWSSFLDNPAFIGSIVTLEPGRLYDSRNGAGRRTPDSTTVVNVVGRFGVPDDASAVLLNVTAVDPSGIGFVTVTPCGFPRRETSNLNVRPGVTVANAVMAKVGIDGEVCIYTAANIDLVVDVNGYVPGLSDVRSVPPARLLDTRNDGAPAPADSTTRVRVLDRFGVPADAEGVILNVTAVGPPDGGFMTVYPCGEDRPLASNLNFVPGEDVPNAVVAAVGDNGEVCIYTVRSLHIVVDVNGYLPAATDVQALAPTRLLDTRGNGGPRPAESTTPLTVAGVNGVPEDATGVILTVTAVQPAGQGFVTVYPCGGELPLASNLNLRPGWDVPNAVVAAVGDDGQVCVFAKTATDLVIDLNGYIP